MCGLNFLISHNSSQYIKSKLSYLVNPKNKGELSTVKGIQKVSNLKEIIDNKVKRKKERLKINSNARDVAKLLETLEFQKELEKLTTNTQANHPSSRRPSSTDSELRRTDSISSLPSLQSKELEFRRTASVASQDSGLRRADSASALFVTHRDNPIAPLSFNDFYLGIDKGIRSCTDEKKDT
ncbi:hypothetical protein [Candidatus Regiella endosymbiont of Tuberolachnus salignus]|uniref:hypothetical protein n=1 Tax=Candidatus Regiella endosymbiont of Tuberolachnus salignus TaxID=3077956 RepID=UPI0030D39ABC